jgi:hypothetical protein
MYAAQEDGCAESDFTCGRWRICPRDFGSTAPGHGFVNERMRRSHYMKSFEMGHAMRRQLLCRLLSIIKNTIGTLAIYRRWLEREDSGSFLVNGNTGKQIRGLGDFLCGSVCFSITWKEDDRAHAWIWSVMIVDIPQCTSFGRCARLIDRFLNPLARRYQAFTNFYNYTSGKDGPPTKAAPCMIVSDSALTMMNVYFVICFFIECLREGLMVRRTTTTTLMSLVATLALRLLTR